MKGILGRIVSDATPFTSGGAFELEAAVLPFTNGILLEVGGARCPSTTTINVEVTKRHHAINPNTRLLIWP